MSLYAQLPQLEWCNVCDPSYKGFNHTNSLRVHSKYATCKKCVKQDTHNACMQHTLKCPKSMHVEYYYTNMHVIPCSSCACNMHVTRATFHIGLAT